MKNLLIAILSFGLLALANAQTRSVLVGTNNTVVQPTNFWSADASNARTGLGLGTAATNSSSAFQPSSSALTNLAAGNGGSLTNLQAASIVGVVSSSNIPASISALSSVVQYFTNLISSATNTITNGSRVYVYSLSPSVTGITNTIQLPTNANSGDVATISHNSTTNSITSIRQQGEVTDLVTISNSKESVKFIYANGSWNILENISFTQPIYFSGTNATANVAASRTNLGLGSGANVSIVEDGGSLTTDDFNAGNVNVSTAVTFTTNTAAAATRTNLGLGATWLTNTNVTNFRTAIGLGETNSPTFDGINVGADIDITLYGMIGYGSEIDLEERDLTAGSGYEWNLGGSGMNTVGAISFANTTNAAQTRTNLGIGATWLTNTNAANFRTDIALGATWLTNTNVTNFRTAIGLGSTNTVQFGGGDTNVVGVGVGSESTGLAAGGAFSGRLGLVYNGNIIMVLSTSTNFVGLYYPITFQGGNASSNAATTRTNLGLGGGVTTNISVTGTNNTNTLYFSNGILTNVTSP